MRNNQPCTASEYVLPDGAVIITHTDPESRITYANEAFLDSSGFTLEECLGEPQNLVRHPDMRPEVFADLRQTIRSGRPWSGLVKNRRKDGGFYWVRAYVSPIVERGQRIGYLSVRVKPTAAEVREAQALYAQMRAGRARHLKIACGVVSDVSAAGRWKGLRELPLGATLALSLGRSRCCASSRARPRPSARP